MQAIWWGMVVSRWHSSTKFRYAANHTVLGAINFAIAAMLYYEFGWHHQSATAFGHFVHVSLGFFSDRHIVYRARSVRLIDGGWKYLVTEVASYSSIYATMWLMVTELGWLAWQGRVLAMLVSSAVHYTMNYFWTFKN